MKVLLLNPPGRRRYVRDYYCSKVAKANYSYSPVDLLLLSGRFENVALLDSIQKRLPPQTCLDRILTERPAAIISLVGAVSWTEDRAFLSSVKNALPRTKILISGDAALEINAEAMARETWLDGVIGDFTNADVQRFLAGRTEAVERMIFRDESGRIIESFKPRPVGIIEDLPLPRHDLFLGQGYAYPFVRGAAFATVQTDYGCPFPCRFCIMSQLGYKVRPVRDVLTELTQLKSSGINEIYFNDQTFGCVPARLEELCQGLIEQDYRLSWCCWSRVDTAYRHLELLKRAGCHTIMFGVESAADETLDVFRKGFTLDQVKRTFGRCRELGLRTVATYIIGLPDEDRLQIERTINLALELDSDFASFNVYVPRPGTETRRHLMEQGVISDDETPLDQTGHFVSVTAGLLSPKEIKAMRDAALRRYYLRPAYLFHRLRGVKSTYDLQVLIRTALTMVWS
ncbi:MAG: radical SAM protein [Thermodesulfobacteriota bacterium]